MRELTAIDVMILGGGPAGAQCAYWLTLLGYKVIIIEKSDRLGGLLHQNPYSYHWMVTVPTMSGPDLANSLTYHIEEEGIEVVYGVDSMQLEERDAGFIITLPERGQSYGCKKLVVATGVKPNDGGFFPSEQLLIGSGHIIEVTDFKNKKVAILGGGDSAFENYGVIQSKGAASVKLFARHIRARDALVTTVPRGDIKQGEYEVDATTLSVDDTVYDIICVMYGFIPVNPLQNHLSLTLDERGFIHTDHRRQTSHPHIYAIGESTQATHPCIVTAMADGVIAAKAIETAFKRSSEAP